ncbi:hypothetical protein DK842_21775 [Chromobacterium phragmitis]|uniref:Uncharacterized protein n=1 Tax=Chromobacterium phragmitis TaxID=2202141 RepID=A0A344UEF2_9NEIS|nr:hypothetical protein [Chromobacterium phragmitis]AXE32310.1 hypothetical protein DK842_21775 [Chromobacterium phragmitis]AXE33650.1 hypothetical protein DK843_04515 [Chromobacterium phragmitis]
MEFLFDLDDPLQCLEHIYQHLSPLVVAFHPKKSAGRTGPCFGSGLLLGYRGEKFIVTTEAVLSTACVNHGQNVVACIGKTQWPLRQLRCASPQHLDLAALHLPADWLRRYPVERCFELDHGALPDPMASAFTLLLGYPVSNGRPAGPLNSTIGVVSRPYLSHTRRNQVAQPLFLEFDSRDILSRCRLDKSTLQAFYQLNGAPAISLYHSFQEDSNRLTAYLQGVVVEWDHARIGATATSTAQLNSFLDGFLQRLQQDGEAVQPELAALLARFRH